VSTNSTFNLNFRLKFLKFGKWSLDSYAITKSPEYPLEKPQDGKKPTKTPGGEEGLGGPRRPGDRYL